MGIRGAPAGHVRHSPSCRFTLIHQRAKAKGKRSFWKEFIAC
jgi:hypothetical protein